jgi:hypothetical protein
MKAPLTVRALVGVWVAAVVGAIVVVAVTVPQAMAAAGADGLPAPGWDLIRSLTWPGATVAVLLFSPVSRAIADWIQSHVRPPAARAADSTRTDPDRERELQANMEAMGEMLREVADSVKRSAEVQARTVDALIQVQQSLAVLLDRTSRTVGGMTG